MYRFSLVLALVIVFTLVFAGLALADQGAPVGGCPDGFELHQMHAMDGDGDMHHHIGNDADQNGDGYLCVQHVGAAGSNHVHIDNIVPCDPDPARCVVVEPGM